MVRRRRNGLLIRRVTKYSHFNYNKKGMVWISNGIYQVLYRNSNARRVLEPCYACAVRTAHQGQEQLVTLPVQIQDWRGFRSLPCASLRYRLSLRSRKFPRERFALWATAWAGDSINTCMSKKDEKRKGFNDFELKREYTEVDSVQISPVKQRPTYRGLRTKTIDLKSRGKAKWATAQLIEPGNTRYPKLTPCVHAQNRKKDIVLLKKSLPPKDQASVVRSGEYEFGYVLE